MQHVIVTVRFKECPRLKLHVAFVTIASSTVVFRSAKR